MYIFRNYFVVDTLVFWWFLANLSAGRVHDVQFTTTCIIIYTCILEEPIIYLFVRHYMIIDHACKLYICCLNYYEFCDVFHPCITACMCLCDDMEVMIWTSWWNWYMDLEHSQYTSPNYNSCLILNCDAIYQHHT